MSESGTLDGLRYTAEAMAPLILDLALARRVEMVEAASAVDRVELLQTIKPGSGAAAERIAGGYAAHRGAESPLTQAVAIGLDGATTQATSTNGKLLPRADQPVRAEVCPLADAAFVEQFGKRGYRVTEFTNVMARTFSPNSVSEQALPPGTVERIESEYADLWGATLADGFC